MATLDLSKYTNLAAGSYIGYTTDTKDTIENGYSLFGSGDIDGSGKKADKVAQVVTIDGVGYAVGLSNNETAGAKAVTDLNASNSKDAWSIVGGANDAHVTNIKTGSGNDSVQMVAINDSATVSTGAGNDSVSIGTANGSLTVELGDGNDALKLSTALGALTVNAGSGANEVSIGKADNTFSYTGGDDDDIVSLGSVAKSADIRLGSGNNEVSVSVAASDLTIESGDGHDSIKVSEVEGNAVVNAGDGNNYVSVANVSGTLQVTTGSGKDSISIGAVEKDATIALGDGADTLEIAGNVEGLLTITGDGEGANLVSVNSSKLDKGVAINLASGKDSVIIDQATVSGSISLGDGKDEVSIANIEKATITSGSGDKKVSLGNVVEGSLTLGSGKDTVSITGNLTDSTLDLGDGRDELTLASVSGSTINLGADKDVVSITGAASESTINLGDGDDTISVGSGKFTDVTISGGAGKDVFKLESLSGSVTISDFEVGTDTLYGGKTFDSAMFTNEGKVSLTSGTVQLAGTDNYAVTYSDGTELYNVAWTGETASTLDASSFTKKAVLIGNNNDDTADTLLGGTKDDTIYAGANDVVYGGAGNDSIVITSSSSDTTYVGFSKNGGKDSVTGMSKSDVVYLFENSVTDISKITTTSGTTLKMGTATLNLGTTEFKLRDSSGSDYDVKVVTGASSVTDVDSMADIYYAADNLKGGLDFSKVNDKLVVDLGNTGVVANTNNAMYLGKYESVKGGSDDTVLVGAAAQSESLFAGTGATTLWGGGSKSDTLVGSSSTDNSVMYVFGEGDGKDVIANANWGNKETSDVLWLTSGTVSSIKNDGTDTTIALSSGDKVTLSKQSDVNVAIKYTTDGGASTNMVKVGKSGQTNTFTYTEGVSSYVGGSSNILSVGSDVDTANIWLDGSQGTSFDSFKTVDAHTSSGDVIIAGVGTTNESLVASKGTSSLWGGAGTSNDTLVGTTGGETTYFFGNGDGKDVITSSHSDDLVNLYNVALSDIADLKTTSTSMEISLNDGSMLTINNMSSSSVKTFQLSDGSKWEYSTSTKSWTQV